ncbi:MAG TPA: hypothetical protein PLQ76_02965 [bacterium]|nr:hypothetical protein [bacterium]
MKRIAKGMLVVMVTIAAAGLIVFSASAQTAKPGKAPMGKPGAPGKGKPAINQEEMNNMVAMANAHLKHRFTPVIKSVSFGPAIAGKPVKVTLSAAYDDKKAIDKIKQAAVYYSTDGGSSFNGPVMLKQSGAAWSGNIPAIKKKGKVIVMPWVKDSYGNVSVNLTCNVKSWPPVDDGCMAPAAVDKAPEDDPSSSVEDEFDIWEIKVGMDSQYLYLTQSVEGDISKGTMNPPHINAYIALAVETPELYKMSDITMMMSPDAKEKYKGKENAAMIVFYAPLAKAAASSAASASSQKGGSGGGGMKIPTCGVPRMAGGKAEINSKDVTCKADGSELYIRIDKKLLTDSMKKGFTLLGAMDGFLDNLSGASLPKVREVANFTRVNVAPSSFTVK